MIKVKVKPDFISISGHADYDEYGKDIVCSSVSSIVTTSVNAIMLFDSHSIKYDVKEGLVQIRIIEEQDSTRKLLDNMLSMFKELERDYPKNIKVER